MPINLHQFDHRETMLEALYREFTNAIETALARDSSATLLLSGGSTPAPLYQRLSAAPLDWEKIHVALVDERWVDADDEASNERLLRESLLTDRAAAAPFTAMKNDASSPFDGVQACNDEYARLPLPHTVCLLGMGADGHTASLFPKAKGLTEALAAEQHCAPILAHRSEVTGERLERMTMTPWSMLQSEKLILLITGADKMKVLQQARTPGDIELMPIRRFIDAEISLEVYWAP